ncbi:MAG: hypothetical protein P4L63_03245 [Candidatus Pacebacteria bacterium]|nr:hypothetical protein [Candidatus Paceibacterota bacterium]
MNIPFFSTFTLFTETIVTISILYVFYSGYKKNKFPFKIVAIALAYEIAFNISYMTYRAISNVKNEPKMPSLILDLAIFHGIFSLVMFVALLIFMGLAWKNYRKGINYFKLHSVFSMLFLICWLVAVFSGIFFYYDAYFSPKENSARVDTLNLA